MATYRVFRRIALGLPEASEVVTWGTDLTFRVNGKIFAMSGDETSTVVSIKASLDAQADLLALDSKTFSKAAYVGRFGWVNVQLADVDDPMLAQLLESAWRQTAPKRLLR